MQNFQIQMDESKAGKRLDAVLAEEFQDFSRSFLQKLISSGQVVLAHSTKKLKPGYKVFAQDIVSISIPDPEPLDIQPENIPLDIRYEDDDLLIVNKPQGMVVHPAAGHTSKTLVNALLYHCQGHLSGINGVLRPGIVHRIDMDTSGILVVCKNDKAHRMIADQLKVHSITRRYQAIVYGHFKTLSGTVDAPIGRHPVDRKKMAINQKNGKEARTNYTVLESMKQNFSYIECALETGRTHQIRVHMTSLNHPLLGDQLYGPAKNPFHLKGQLLHARVLGFVHPSTNQYVEFEAELPEHFMQVLCQLREQ